MSQDQKKRSPMLLEPHWIDAFEQILRRCAVRPGDTVAILTETQSRPVLPELARRGPRWRKKALP